MLYRIIFAKSRVHQRPDQWGHRFNENIIQHNLSISSTLKDALQVKVLVNPIGDFRIQYFILFKVSQSKLKTIQGAGNQAKWKNPNPNED